ncbi:MAG: toxic anion resistance protein, partial [Geminicoccaceae bacterium]
MATTTETTSTTPMPMTPESLLKGDLIPYSQADADKRIRIEKCIIELEMDDANSIIFFGSKAQKQLTTISDHMLEGVRN